MWIRVTADMCSILSVCQHMMTMGGRGRGSGKGRKKPTSRHPSSIPAFGREKSLPGDTFLVFGLWGEKKPTWGYPASLRTLGRQKANLGIPLFSFLFFFFSFFSFSLFFFFFFLFLFCGAGKGHEGGEGRGGRRKKPFSGYHSFF